MSKKLICLFLAIFLFVFAFSSSFLFPILDRNIFYKSIDKLDLQVASSFSNDQIKEAYDDVLDFLVKGKEFKTGDLKYSQDGKAHFEDCKKLFTLDFILSASSFILSVFFLYLFFKKKCKNIINHFPSYYSGIFLLAIMLFVTVFVLVDFDLAFTLFHMLFFRGKSNWLFDPKLDEIILVLPEEFFLICALIVIVTMIIFSIIYIILGRKKNGNKYKIKY